MVSALLLALLKAALLPAAGVLGALAYSAWWLWRHPDLNDWADHS